MACERYRLTVLAETPRWSAISWLVQLRTVSVVAGEVPRGQQVRAGSTHVPHAYVAHDAGKVQVGVGDGPLLALDGERGLGDAHAPAVLAHEVRLVSQHVEGEAAGPPGGARRNL